MDLKSVLRAYRRYAPIYDLMFGPVMKIGRLRTVEAVNRLGKARILEVGVGTGLSLPHYRKDMTVVGIDVSSEMLNVAHKRVAERKLTNIESLREMDAEKLEFEDASFDVVVAMYVMSVVPNPARCLAEMQRVCKPSGTVMICNHFLAEDEPRGRIEKMMAPMGRWLGWRPDFAIDKLLDESALQVISNSPVPPFKLFNVVECRNRDSVAAES
ncbi:MAG: class I SAM-dependent methyltransferase [Rhodospirillales bacterium]|nr:class I SAM-dependent methyltransferase [Rhodospirillales bacterium]